MMKQIIGATAGLLAAQAALADPAVFRDETLVIPQGAVVVDGQVSYFNDIVLQQTADGELMVASADPGLPVGGAWLEDEGAVYADGEIRISSAAVITGDGEGEYYSDVVLEENEGGAFTIASGTRQSLAPMREATTIAYVAGAAADYAVIRLEGDKASPCHVLLEPAISVNQDTATISVLVAQDDQAGLGQEDACAQVVTPFDRSMYLPVTDLEEGTYTIDVNGEATAFITLPPVQ